MKKSPLLLACLWLSLYSFSQKEMNNWYFGDSAAISFNSGQPVPFTGGGLKTVEGCASISDSSGNTLFYTDGVSVWDRTNTVMPNGDSLTGHFSSAESAVIVPNPANSNQYYIFTAGVYDTREIPYRYNIVDMTLHNGNGDVTSSKNVILYNAGATEKLAVVSNASHTGYWIVTHQDTSANFVCFQLTAAGLSAPVISPVSRVYRGEAGMGYIKFSDDGKTLASALHGIFIVEMYSFNASTGKLTYSYMLDSGIEYVYGLAFSPDNSKFYATGVGQNNNLYQYDLRTGDSTAIRLSKTLVGVSKKENSFGAIQRGPDNKLYIGRFRNSYISVIDHPDSLGVACNFIDSALILGGPTSELGLPNFPVIPNTLCNAERPHLAADKISFCGADSAVICAPVGYAAYQWGDGDSNTCRAAHRAGNYFVTVRDNGNCSYTSDTVVITPGNATAPVITASKTVFCPGDSAQVCNTAPGSGFTWNDEDTGACIYAKNAGNYYVTVTDTAGCTAQSNRISINTYPVPSVSIVQHGDTLFSYGATTYQWYSNNKPIPGATQPEYIAAAGSNYTVVVTDTNGCTAKSSAFVITGWQDVSNNETVQVYPNPTSVSNWQLSVSKDVVGAKLEMYDAVGRIVFQSTISKQKSEIPACTLPAGIYFIRINTTGETQTVKLVKE